MKSLFIENLCINFLSPQEELRFSSLQGLNEVHLFLVTTYQIYKRHELKILKFVSINTILTHLNFKLCRTDKHLTSLRENVLPLLVRFLHQVSHNRYCDKLLKNILRRDKSCKLYQCGKMMHQISLKLICYYAERHMFFFLIYIIGDWSLNNRFISRDFFNN